MLHLTSGSSHMPFLLSFLFLPNPLFAQPDT
jgi:hypothetical protein